MKKRNFQLKRLPGLNGQRNWYRANVPGVEISARIHFDFVWVSLIRITNPLKRGKGLGTEVMKGLIDWARKHDKGVRLLAEAEKKRDQRRLEQWYYSLGFARTDETGEFVIEH